MAGIRIFGLGSGLDIDQIVSDMMKAERTRRIYKLERSKQTNLWKQELYQEINRDIANFILETKKEFGLTSSTSSGVLLNKSADSFTWVKNASSTDENIVNATASAKALNGSYNINITQLAENVFRASTESISISGKTSSDPLSEQFAINPGEILTFKIRTNITEGDSTNYPHGFKEFTFDTSANSLDDVIEEINNSNIGISASYDSDLDRFFLNTNSTGSNNYFEILDDSHSFLSTDEDVELGNESGNNILKLKIANDDDGSQTDGKYKYSGKDLKFDFGDATGLTKSSNVFTVNGINITAKNTGTVTVNVDTDVESVYEKVTNFVDKYNELIDKINGELNEKVYRDYQPLTDDEKEELTEDQIEKWEDMAKSGLLRNDSILSKLLSDVRLGLYDTVSGLNSSMNQLTEIGIETGEYSSKGKLEIDEVKLKEAIINNANGVIELLFKEPSSEVNKDDSYLTEEQRIQKYNESGLIYRMFNTMIEGMKDIIDKAGPGNDSELLRDVKSNILIDFTTGTNLKNGSISILEESILDLEKELLEQEDILASLEERYYNKFTAMETALNQMNQQSSWLMSQLGMGGLY